MSDRLGITGAGVFTAFGDVDDSLAALLAGESALTMNRLRGVDGLSEIPGAPAADGADPRAFVGDRKLLKYMSPTSRMAVLAAGRALQDAGLMGSTQQSRRQQMALLVTTSLIAFDPSEVAGAIAASRTADGALSMRRMGAEGFRRCHPLMPFKMLLNMPIGLISMIFGVAGDNAIYYPDPTQAVSSIGSAARGIVSGRFERALVGATHHGQSLFPLCSLDRLGLLASSVEAAEPFSKQHAGYAPADGAAFLVLESAAAAAERGTEPLATLELDDGAAQDPSRCEIVVASGSSDRRRDERLLARVAPRRALSFDGQVGYLGSAGPVFCAAVVARALARGDDAALFAARARCIQVLACDTDGRSAGLGLSRGERA